MNFDFLTSDVSNIEHFLEKIICDGGRKTYALQGSISHLGQMNGMSGYHYSYEGIEGQLQVGLILGGTGFSLKRVLKIDNKTLERYDYFNLQGELSFTSDKETLHSLIVDFHDMDVTCPILNHFYNFLSLEYKNATEGKSQTALVHKVENILRVFYRSSKIHLPIKNNADDPSIDKIYKKILATEMDPVLTWEERQLVFKKYRDELYKIVSTKTRAHQLSKLKFKAKLFNKDCQAFFARLLARPANNLKGLFYRYTMGKIIWFFQTVRNNLGYSIALAVYGPFTYYFITMPMNPHAMQAVGRVRASYLEAKNQISQILDRSETVINDIKSKDAVASAPAILPSQVTDSVSTKASVSLTPVTSNIIGPSAITSSPAGSSSILNMLLTTDLASTDQISWQERMSNFKQMQIAYEENIEYASRMGRLEQLETQYNFPMQVEAAWQELERYNNHIFKIREENPNLSAKLKQYLFNEVNRTQQLELYLWDRMSRFILDQIYVMLDQDKEQKRNDYYVGRSFVFMEEMTNILSWRYKDFKKPQGYEKIQTLADFYKKNRKETGSVLQNLSANSDLFKQKDLFDTKEFRAYMKRQWEILFLQNAKAEEASNMGLNMYIWSVRNTIWILQSLYAARNEELNLLVKRDLSGQPWSSSEMLTRSRLSLQYETLVHNLTLEYVGIREEIMNRLGHDIESKQRMTVIENLKEFLTDREKLDNLGLAQNKPESGKRL